MVSMSVIFIQKGTLDVKLSHVTNTCLCSVSRIILSEKNYKIINKGIYFSVNV